MSKTSTDQALAIAEGEKAPAGETKSSTGRAQALEGPAGQSKTPARRTKALRNRAQAPAGATEFASRGVDTARRRTRDGDSTAHGVKKAPREGESLEERESTASPPGVKSGSRSTTVVKKSLDSPYRISREARSGRVPADNLYLQNPNASQVHL